MGCVFTRHTTQIAAALLTRQNPLSEYNLMFGQKASISLLAFAMIFFTLGWAGKTAMAQESAERLAPWVVVLGIAQDAGYPQAGCKQACCEVAWQHPERAKWAVSLAIVDPATNQRWLVECTPDFKYQLHALDQIAPPESGLGIDGIFLTHAHIGHYAGLVNLGREVIGANEIPVHVMPRLGEFLQTSGPWNQLIALNNISLQPLKNGKATQLNDRLTLTPLQVPHRGEYSETVAFRIQGPKHSLLFLPDIDKWERWEKRIEDEIALVDFALIDSTFFDGQELPGRDMTKIPHPFVFQTLERFDSLPASEKSKIHLLHFNHSNPLLDEKSQATQRVELGGLKIAKQLQTIPL